MAFSPARTPGAKMNGRMPTIIRVDYYSAAKHYLEAVKAIGSEQAEH